MDHVKARFKERVPTSRKGIKRSHFFHGFVWIIGWLAPPVAILIRFGVGWDLFINTILTICGYIPGHAHKCYCQNIRNNKTKNRTPRWAIRAGLVEMNDPRAGRHQWAYRYDERVAGSGAYGDDQDSLRSGEWDGRGAEPERNIRNNNGNHRHRFSPWGDIVDDDQVEGEPRGGLSRQRSNLASPATTRAANEPAPDPFENEQFYSNAPERPDVAPRKSKKKFGSGLLKNRSRYEQPFETDGLQSSRTRSRTDDFQDEFEREINTGSSQPPAPAAARFDSFDQEGPEDAWASSRPAATTASRGNGSAQPLQPQKTGRAEDNDGDLFDHRF
ncbi:YqaE/Pmp3 family membrane protein [Rhodotorula paludigena]|uniref:YqaE/Pmp3 family membrane protein n=1 Tax=Rhodotorula paludigena TaxID=86838 RepID=UPI003177774F